MVKIVKTPSIARDYMSKSELYGGWPKHGMFSGPSKPLRRKKVIIDNSEIEKIIEEEEDCCVSPDEI